MSSYFGQMKLFLHLTGKQSLRTVTFHTSLNQCRSEWPHYHHHHHLSRALILRFKLRRRHPFPSEHSAQTKAPLVRMLPLKSATSV
ncbi:hypothetical protein ES332_A13G204100v1 [Gossypium tomentosum]|uniref:Uncharacterized protein n=1 Tax=Gossypium tomentosum TaxID=34277 RepID=A0A5D2MMS6_GOSTO|nr:hypothetical protein ES332_A13G204100v1 [Gossypium tomentosum]